MSDIQEEIKEILQSILFRLYCDSPISKKYGLELDKNECKLLLDYITNLQKENNKQKEVLDKIKKYINKHCVNQDVSKEVGFKCFTMADTQELEHIWNLLEEIE